MDESSNALRNGLSPEARRSYVDTASLTPRDKENAGANSTRNSQSETEQSKSSSAPTPQAPPSNRTPGRSRLNSQGRDQKVPSTFFPAASPPSPATGGTAAAVVNESSNSKQTQQQKHHSPTSTPTSTLDWTAQKSPPGTSQVLRKHFQSLGFATPGGKQTQQHRLLSSGAVRLTTPNSRKKAYTKGIDTTMNRLGYDGTKHTPSKELMKSTASSRSHRIANLQDMSMDQVAWEDQSDFQIQQLQNQLYPSMDAMHDDESSTVTSNATLDDASFDSSLPGMNNHTYAGNSLLEPQSPMTPRMGCSDPVALTLLNDGKEDYHFLMAQDALFPVPKIEDRDETASGHPETSRPSPSASSPASCLSPASRQSPAEVRGTLSQRARSTLARPVAIMAKGGRVSPSSHQPPKLMMRPQPKHIR